MVQSIQKAVEKRPGTETSKLHATGASEKLVDTTKKQEPTSTIPIRMHSARFVDILWSSLCGISAQAVVKLCLGVPEFEVIVMGHRPLQCRNSF